MLARSCARWWPDFVTFTACEKSRFGLKGGKKAQCISNRCKDLFEWKKYFGVRCTLKCQTCLFGKSYNYHVFFTNHYNFLYWLSLSGLVCHWHTWYIWLDNIAVDLNSQTMIPLSVEFRRTTSAAEINSSPPGRNVLYLAKKCWVSWCHLLMKIIRTTTTKQTFINKCVWRHLALLLIGDTT